MMSISKKQPLPPVIIIGMHRSGTSMIANMLDELGLFSGTRKDRNHEAMFFQELNDWIFRQCGSAWDHPASIQYLIGNREVRAMVENYTRYSLRTPRSIGYLGWKMYARHLNISHLDIPWGWKDPRNTYTLPIWLDLFPGARVIHIYRHGVDVANSLKVRQDRVLAHEKAIYQKRRLFYFLIPKRSPFTHSVRCSSLEGGFSLWEEYLREARKHLSELGERALEIKYEDFILNPQDSLKTLAAFCCLPHDNATVEALAGTVLKGRVYAYRTNPELKAFADTVAARLRGNGY
jgi:hypothetical protein